MSAITLYSLATVHHPLAVLIVIAAVCVPLAFLAGYALASAVHASFMRDGFNLLSRRAMIKDITAVDVCDAFGTPPKIRSFSRLKQMIVDERTK